MKKLIGIVGVAFVAIAMFFNTNTMNGSNSDFDLASLLTMNTANAEACLDSSYLPGQKRSISGAETCYNSSGIACGNQEICEAGGTGCTEHVCNV